MLLIFGLALVLNVNTASAANVTSDLIKPKVTAVNPANNSIILNSKPIKVTYSEPIKFGNRWIELKTSSGTVKPITTSIYNRTLTVTPTTALAKGVTYKLIIHSNSVKDKSGNGANAYITNFSISKLTLAQVKDGQSRAQTFYNTYNRLPSYVSFGTTKIPITEFQKILASVGLKISTRTSSAASTAGTVTAYGWNSCSLGWYKTGGTFTNYCPFCHSYGCLIYNPKHTYEGEWTCNKCDSDFCNCGRCKASGSQVYLTSAP